jgi:hypothetical protein
VAAPEAIALAHYRRQVSLAQRIAAEILGLWRGLDPAALDLSWAAAASRALALLTGGQLLAASDADGYLTEVLDAQRIDPAAAGAVNARSLTGVASDGRDLTTLLGEPLIATKTAIGRGATPDRALTIGGVHLDMIARTQLADAGRVAVGLAMAARPQATGYVRMLSPPSCARCVILAGRVYRWNQGFARHPRCDCRHIPTRENSAGDLRTDPRAYVESLDRAEQDRILTKAGAQAVRDGANLGQVVNARRGMETAANGRLATRTVFGQQAFTTTEGVTRRGLAGQRLTEGLAGKKFGQHRAIRLMPEQIYADSRRLGWSREETIAQLRRHGYIL